MGYLLEIIGVIIFLFTGANSTQAESAVHQIFFQLEYMTAAILFASGLIIINIQSLKKEIKKNNESKEAPQKDTKDE